MLKIISNNNEHLSLNILGRNNLTALDYWDSNWLTAHIDLNLRSIQAQYDLHIRTDELEYFYHQLHNLKAAIRKEAVLATMEAGLSLTLSLKSTGTIICKGKAQPDEKNFIEFSFSMDNLEIDSVLQQLNALLKTYPVIGTLE